VPKPRQPLTLLFDALVLCEDYDSSDKNSYLLVKVDRIFFLRDSTSYSISS